MSLHDETEQDWMKLFMETNKVSWKPSKFHGNQVSFIYVFEVTSGVFF